MEIKRSGSIFRIEPYIINGYNKEDYDIKHSCKEWADWSLKEHTFKEIKDRLLDNFSSVCMTYVCGTSAIPEDKILELGALGTGLLRRTTYSKDLKIVKKMLEYSYGLCEATNDDFKKFYNLYIRRLNKSTFIKYESLNNEEVLSLLCDRLDWTALCRRNNFSEDFLDKFNKFIQWKELRVCRVYSDEFLSKYRDLLPKFEIAKEAESTDYE